MNKKGSYTFFIILLLLLCLDIHSKSFDSFYIPNFLLVYLVYILYTHSSLYQSVITVISIELISLLQTGANGLSAILLMPLILQFQALKRLLHNKLLAPFIFIAVYKILYELSLYALFSDRCNYIHICIQIVTNYIAFLILYRLQARK